MFCEVYLIDAPYHIDRPFDYSAGENLFPGQIVKVPFGRTGNYRIGVITKLKETTDVENEASVKSVHSVICCDFALSQIRIFS